WIETYGLQIVCNPYFLAKETDMPKDPSIRKVLIIGSGPIVIGQAAEFDYAGTQACIACREEGVEVVLVNSNPATIQTDPDMADRVYIEPLTLESLVEIIRKERPDGLIATMGGQTGLNLAMDLERAGRVRGAGAVVARPRRPRAGGERAARAERGRVGRDRVRGPARRRGQRHHRVQYGEHGPDGRAHRRVDSRGPQPDPLRRRLPAP